METALSCHRTVGLHAPASTRLARLGRLAAHPQLSLQIAGRPNSRSTVLPAPHAARPHGVFFTHVEEGTHTYKLPCEPQQLLGLLPGEAHKDSDVNQAFDNLLNAKLEPGYSQQISESRFELLSYVRSYILSCKRTPLDRRDRDTTIATDLLPACLALLAELGRNELVLQLGTDLLSSGGLKGFASTENDVLLSMALAKCNMAHEAFATSTQVVDGCQHLEEALQLLLPKGRPPVAPGLVREVQASLVQLACQCAMEQVSGPVCKEREEERRHAVRNIREMLKQADSDASPSKASSGAGTTAVNRDFMARLVPLLTCDELVHLQEWEHVARHASAHKWVYPGLIERVAVGHILLGYQQGQPAYIQMAVQLLKHLGLSSEALVAQAVCQVLLGKVHSALELLTQAQTAAPRTSASDIPPSPLWGPQANAYVQKNTPAGEDGMLPGLCKYTQLWLNKVPLPLFRDAVDASPPASLTTYFENTRVEALITVYDEKGGNLTESMQGALTNLKQGVGRMQEVARTSLAAAGAGATSIKLPDMPAPTVLADLPPLSNPTARKLVAPAAAVAGLLAVALVMWPRGGQEARAGQVPVAASTKASQGAGRQVVQDMSTQLQPKVAEQVIRLWQEVKGQALGSSYDASRLQDVLTNPLLDQTRAHVNKLKADKEFMKYKLHKLKVKDVDNSKGPGFASVAATWNESAYLLEEGQQIDGYTGLEYDVQYEFVKGKDNVWRVASVLVINQKTAV